MPFYMGDFMAATACLSHEEKWAYLLLIWEAWKNNGLIKSDKKSLKNVTKISSKKLENILPFFKEKNGYLYHDKINKELLKSNKIQEVNATRAKKAAAGRWKKGNASSIPSSNASNHAPAMLEQSTPTTTPYQIQTPKLSREEVGVLKNGSGGEGKWSVEAYLDDKARERARKNAPRWDLAYLINVYNQGIAAGEREKPTHPNAAFPVWCGKYTKGKPPSYS